jgi:hypothetical protein
MSAARCGWLEGKAVRALLFMAAALATVAQPVSAQQDTVIFFAGAGAALGLHESGHLALDAAFDASPGLKKVSFGPLPFFAITHEAVSAAQEFAISSAGFWVQHATDEILLSRRPMLRDQHAPALKGMLAFNVLTSVAYAGAAFAQVGPDERDTRGMALSADVPEPVIGALVLAPAALDAVRYYKPDARWAAWASRAAKIGQALLILKARS